MWVEVDEQGHQCAMLSFYPDFETPSDVDVNCLFLVDCSASMKVRFSSPFHFILSNSLHDRENHLKTQDVLSSSHSLRFPRPRASTCSPSVPRLTVSSLLLDPLPMRLPSLRHCSSLEHSLPTSEALTFGLVRIIVMMIIIIIIIYCYFPSS